MILFILSVNSLSHFLKQLKGYAAGIETNINITHNFFVDGLKMSAETTNNLKKLLDIVTTFSKDIDMKCGIHKYAYIKINAGKQTNSEILLEMSNLIIQPVAYGHTYKYFM